MSTPRSGGRLGTTALVLLGLASSLEAQATRRIDHAFDGGAPDMPVSVRAIAGNGRFLLLESAATNLVPDDTNGVVDLFVYDAARDSTERVSVSSSGTQGDGFSRRGTISPDGRFVAFESRSSQLVPDDTNDDVDIFVRDRATRTTVRVNLNNAGNEARRNSAWGSVSADGRHVAFDSLARNLTVDDTDLQNDVFVRDRDPDGNGVFDEGNGRTTRLSRPVFGGAPDGGSYFPRISGNGRFVVFHSIASNIAPDDGNADWDVFVHDRDPDGNGVFDEGNGRTSILSVSTSGVQGNRASRDAVIDASGRHAAFWSESRNLVPGDTNGQLDVFVRDLVLERTVRVSVTSSGVQGDGESRDPSLSADGRFVAFRSLADDLVPGDTNARADVFVHDRDPDGNGVFDEGNGVTRRESLSPFDTQGNGSSDFTRLSADGRFVAFDSTSTNLTADGLADGSGVYLRDRIRLTALTGEARSTVGFVVDGAAGLEGRPVWIVLGCTGTKPGTLLGRNAWLPLILDPCSFGGVVRPGLLHTTVGPDGRAVVPPWPLRPLHGEVPRFAAALVFAPNAVIPWPVTPPVEIPSALPPR